jgi:hypothetical protein
MRRQASEPKAASVGTSIEYTGQHILVLAPPTIVVMLSGVRELAKVLRTPPWPTDTGQHNPIRAATDRAPRSMHLADCGPLSHAD